jgi:drug/metabolite transporter (DMT)-like permease
MSPNDSTTRSVINLTPAVAAGVSLGISDVLAKLVLASGADVLSMLTFRSVIGLAFVASWLRFGNRPKTSVRARVISMASGVMFAGLIFCLFKAIEAIDVPTAVLSYFTYPLLTGISASLFGFEPLRFRGVLCALAAFLGLGIMIGAHPAGPALAGVVYGVGAACCRTGVLLATRAWLMDADARLTTWYSMISSTALFIAVSLAKNSWHMPQTGLGWSCLIALSLATTAAILFVFVSTVRIGPFRTALIMHLEPLSAMIMSALLLAEIITPLQGLGSAIMLAALIAFQIWR